MAWYIEHTAEKRRGRQREPTHLPLPKHEARKVCLLGCPWRLDSGRVNVPNCADALCQTPWLGCRRCRCIGLGRRSQHRRWVKGTADGQAHKAAHHLPPLLPRLLRPILLLSLPRLLLLVHLLLRVLLLGDRVLHHARRRHARRRCQFVSFYWVHDGAERGLGADRNGLQIGMGRANRCKQAAQEAAAALAAERRRQGPGCTAAIATAVWTLLVRL